MKRIISYFIVLSVMLIPLTALVAFAELDFAADTIYCFYGAINEKDWETVLLTQASLEYEEMKKFLYSQDAPEERLGVFNINSVHVAEIYEFDLDSPDDFRILNSYTYIREIMLRYDVKIDDGFKVFLTTVEMDVKTESEYMRNGIDLHIEYLIEEEGRWKYAGTFLAPPEVIEYVYPEERRELDIRKILELKYLELEYNVVANLNGEILNINRSDFVNFKNFEDIRKITYTPGQFIDVDEDAWYGANSQAVIKSAYETQIINGLSDGSFKPEDRLTVAQGIKMAAVTKNTYCGGEESFEQGNPWYKVYVDYALKNGIITENMFDSFDREITRAEAARLFAYTLPKETLLEFNEIESIPDVDSDTLYADSIFLLYRSGVLFGNNSSGVFRPNGGITRAEAAAVIVRIAMPTERRYVFSAYKN